MYKITTVVLLAYACISGAFAESCANPKVEATSFTSLDATVVTQIAYITEFSLKCDNSLPENYALYAEVDGKALTAARVGQNKYQVSWTEEPGKARSGVHEINILDEEGWASLRRARRSDSSATVAPLLAIQLHHLAHLYLSFLVSSQVVLKHLEYILPIMTIKPIEKASDSDDDPVETMLKKTGCLELHYKVQECIAETKDWRKCQNAVNDFRECISRHKQEHISQHKN